ncbi:hypothetical protein PIB30_059771 [Stylosanthes scabra]|uniref:Putative plant transposon protein domain-containing protein n=1 Tax=Stylosanthes scabra TaxID=79078 RepID=A0ABU6RKP1_9FABA|nr:hypothetical protein [Stylosanthes scabra]
MARTKTTNRNTGAEIHPPSTRSALNRASREPSPQLEQPPPPPPPASARSNSSRGKRPMTEEPPPPPRYQGSGYRSLLHPIVESNEARPPLYKSFYDEFPEESFSKKGFTMLRNYLFWKNSVVDRPLCGSFLVDLNHLKRKGLDFTDMIAFQGWTALFHIKECVYPEMVKEFYANMYYHNGLISSYVRRRNVYLDAERIGEILGYTDEGLTVYTSGKWDSDLNLSYNDALACICTRISLNDGVTPTHRSLGPVYAQLHHIITHIILPQNCSYQKHMHDCIKADRNSALPYGMFLTKVFKAYFVNLDDEPYEEKFSYLKGGGAVKRTAKRDLRAGKRAMEEKERRSRASSICTRKSKGSGIKLLVTVVRELIQEVINMASCTSTTIEKSKARGKILERYLKKLKDDHEFFEPEEEDEEEPQDSQEEDEDVSDAN